MRELLTLFVIFLLFVILSVTAGAGVYLIQPSFAKPAAGFLLLLSVAATVWTFASNFVWGKK